MVKPDFGGVKSFKVELGVAFASRSFTRTYILVY